MSDNYVPNRVAPAKPSAAFVGVSWFAFAVGAAAYIIGVWNNTEATRNDRFFYFTVWLLGLFGAVCVTKAVRDKEEGIPVTGMFVGLSWAAALLSVALISFNLWEADMMAVTRGFLLMGFLLSLFATIVIQKNVRDSEAASRVKGGFQ